MDWLTDATCYPQTCLAIILVVCLWSSTGYSGGVRPTSENLHYAIHEERETGLKIADIVNDAGLHEYGVDVIALLRFKFLNQPVCRVVIDERTGVIWTSGRIDRETLCRTDVCQVRLDIVVQPMTYFQIVKVSVDILDINDNSPVFSPSSAAHEMLESAAIGSFVSLPSAVDVDTSAFAVRRYELVAPQRKFELKEIKKPDGSTDLRLILVESLDREQESMHRVTVYAYDGGDPARRGSLNVTISVLDVNDNAPVFERESYHVTITENCPLQATVLRVRATDRDVGRNAELTYFLGVSSSQNFGDTFHVDNATGEIVVVGVVDYETTPVYQLMVSVRDNGPDPVSADAMVTIRVQDSNDNAPQITVNTLVASDTRSASVPENATVGTFVGHVIVRDPDGDVSGSVSCRLSGDDAFELRHMYEAEFQIVTTASGSLDREVRASYDLKILCQDGGRPQMTSSRHVTIDVTDVNDNSPSFGQSFYSAEIVENNPIGSVVIRVSATDLDSGANADVIYSLFDPADDEGASAAHLRSFDVHPKQGLVRAVASLDRELSPRHRVTLLAVDRGLPARTGTAVLEVNVIDANDERPEFAHGASLTMGVRENQSPGTPVGTLRAVDADSPPNDIFSFAVQSSDPQGNDDGPPFEVDPKSGRIVTTRFLDREERDNYYLTVTVTDDGNRTLSSTATVTIVVQDVNDHAPSFAHPPAPDGNLTVAIFNRALRGHVVTRLRATDRDAGKNGHVMYSIERGNDAAMFRINSTSGVISLDLDLQGERDNQLIVLRVMAFDRGTPRLSSFVDLTIIINRSTELPLGLHNQPSSAAPAASDPFEGSSDSAAASPSSQGALNVHLVIGAIGGSIVLLAILTAFGLGIFLVWNRHRRKRLYIDRKDRAVRALTLSEELKLSGGEETPLSSERAREDFCSQALLKGALDDDVKVPVKPDILSRSPRRLRPDGRHSDDSLGNVGQKSRDDDDDEDESNDVDEDVAVTSIDCDIVTLRWNQNQVHCSTKSTDPNESTMTTTTMRSVPTGATQRSVCNGQNHCVNKVPLQNISHSPVSDPSCFSHRKAFTTHPSSSSGALQPSVPMDIWVPRTELEPSTSSVQPSPSRDESVGLPSTHLENSFSTFKQNRPSPILPLSGTRCNFHQENNATKLTSMV